MSSSPPQPSLRPLPSQPKIFHIPPPPSPSPCSSASPPKTHRHQLASINTYPYLLQALPETGITVSTHVLESLSCAAKAMNKIRTKLCDAAWERQESGYGWCDEMLWLAEVVEHVGVQGWIGRVLLEEVCEEASIVVERDRDKERDRGGLRGGVGVGGGRDARTHKQQERQHHEHQQISNQQAEATELLCRQVERLAAEITRITSLTRNGEEVLRSLGFPGLVLGGDEEEEYGNEDSGSECLSEAGPRSDDQNTSTTASPAAASTDVEVGSDMWRGQILPPRVPVTGVDNDTGTKYEHEHEHAHHRHVHHESSSSQNDILLHETSSVLWYAEEADRTHSLRASHASPSTPISSSPIPLPNLNDLPFYIHILLPQNLTIPRRNPASHPLIFPNAPSVFHFPRGCTLTQFLDILRDRCEKGLFPGNEEEIRGLRIRTRETEGVVKAAIRQVFNDAGVEWEHVMYGLWEGEGKGDTYVVGGMDEGGFEDDWLEVGEEKKKEREEEQQKDSLRASDDVRYDGDEEKENVSKKKKNKGKERADKKYQCTVEDVMSPTEEKVETGNPTNLVKTDNYSKTTKRCAVEDQVPQSSSRWGDIPIEDHNCPDCSREVLHCKKEEVAPPSEQKLETTKPSSADNSCTCPLPSCEGDLFEFSDPDTQEPEPNTLPKDDIIPLIGIWIDIAQALQIDNDDLQQQLKGLSSEYNVLRLGNDDLQEQLKSLSSDYDDLQLGNEDLNLQLKQLSDEYAEMTKTAIWHMDMLVNMEEEASTAKEEVDALKLELQELKVKFKFMQNWLAITPNGFSVDTNPFVDRLGGLAGPNLAKGPVRESSTTRNPTTSAQPPSKSPRIAGKEQHGAPNTTANAFYCYPRTSTIALRSLPPLPLVQFPHGTTLHQIRQILKLRQQNGTENDPGVARIREIMGIREDMGIALPDNIRESEILISIPTPKFDHDTMKELSAKPAVAAWEVRKGSKDERRARAHEEPRSRFSLDSLTSSNVDEDGFYHIAGPSQAESLISEVGDLYYRRIDSVDCRHQHAQYTVDPPNSWLKLSEATPVVSVRGGSGGTKAAKRPTTPFPSFDLASKSKKQCTKASSAKEYGLGIPPTRRLERHIAPGAPSARMSAEFPVTSPPIVFKNPWRVVRGVSEHGDELERSCNFNYEGGRSGEVSPRTLIPAPVNCSSPFSDAAAQAEQHPGAQESDAPQHLYQDIYAPERTLREGYYVMRGHNTGIEWRHQSGKGCEAWSNPQSLDKERQKCKFCGLPFSRDGRQLSDSASEERAMNSDDTVSAGDMERSSPKVVDERSGNEGPVPV